MSIPDMTPVDSSNVEAVGHDPENETLYVTFWAVARTRTLASISKLLKNYAMLRRWEVFLTA